MGKSECERKVFAGEVHICQWVLMGFGFRIGLCDQVNHYLFLLFPLFLFWDNLETSNNVDQESITSNGSSPVPDSSESRGSKRLNEDEELNL
ncbi:unnamed protein product [Prunus brigantina]